MAQKDNYKLRIGIVGAGNIVRTRHLPALKKNSDAEIVAVSNSTYESSEQFCKEHCPGATPMANWADLLAVPDLDIIWIGTPPAVRLQSFTGVYLNPEAPAHWRQKIEISGLNVLTLGIYVEVLQRWLGNIAGVF